MEALSRLELAWLYEIERLRIGVWRANECGVARIDTPRSIDNLSRTIRKAKKSPIILFSQDA